MILIGRNTSPVEKFKNHAKGCRETVIPSRHKFLDITQKRGAPRFGSGENIKRKTFIKHDQKKDEISFKVSLMSQA